MWNGFSQGEIPKFTDLCEGPTSILLPNNYLLITSILAPSHLGVRVGDHNLHDPGDTAPREQFFPVEAYFYIMKPRTTDNAYWGNVIGGPNDIFILKLEEHLPAWLFMPACLPKYGAGPKYDGKEITLAGWGIVSDYPNCKRYQNCQNATNAHEVKVTVESARSCDARINSNNNDNGKIFIKFDFIQLVPEIKNSFREPVKKMWKIPH